jgi:hypothetical protein
MTLPPSVAAPVGNRLTIALVVFALIVIPFAVYVGGYFLLGERQDWYVAGHPTETRPMGLLGGD